MDAITQTKPRLFKSGKPILTDLLLADPSITLIETGKSLGVLLAESCYDDTLGHFYLERVTWARWTSGQSLAVRSFTKVALYRHSSGYFLAQDTGSQKIFPFPSAAIYWVIFLTQQQYHAFQPILEQQELRKFMELFRPRVQELPGFAFSGETITAPPDYANSFVPSLAKDMMSV
jgi:hypothetical protein